MVTFIKKRAWLTVGALAIIGLLGGSATAFEYSWFDDLGRWNDPGYVDAAACHTALSYNALASPVRYPFTVASAWINKLSKSVKTGAA